MDLSSSILLVAGFSMLALYGPYMFYYIQSYMKWSFSPVVLVHMSNLTPQNVGYLFVDMFAFSTRVLGPFAIVLLVIALLINFSQVGLRVSLEAIKPQLNKLNPISGLKRIFSLRSITELVKSVFKIVIVGWISYSTILGAMPQFAQMTIMEVREAMSLFVITTLLLALKIGAVLIFLGILDLVYQRYDFERSIKMSKQEVKDEYKQREGDPLVRRRIREKQREIAVRRMMAAVPEADVVITNPVELAVALQYVSEEMYAPKVVAKGGGVVAEKIKEVAREHDVPIVENRSLAQSLFRLTDVGDFVPPELFKAVAEILAYVYKISNKEHQFGI